MKLLHYTLRNLLLPLLVLFAAWGVVFYFLILHEVDDETNDSLANYKEILIRSMLTDSTLLKDREDLMTRYSIREVPPEMAKPGEERFYDTEAYIELEGEYEPVRALRTYFMTADHRFYELTIQTSTLEKDDMVETILASMAVLYAALLLCMLLVVRFAFRKSFRPLYRLLDWLRRFHVGRPNPPLDNPTAISEFVILNRAVEESSLRSAELYARQKQFVENAAHELQTPLAICLNKLELFGEDPTCTEQQLESVAAIHRTLSRLVRLNKSLLLLSRIENRQFPDAETVSFNRLVREAAEGLEALYEERGITLTLEEQGEWQALLNPSLAATLVNNLMKNAYVHNREGGRVRVTLTRYSLTVANTGVEGPLDAVTLFDRFSRQNGRKGSTGLGLAIVQSIARLYHLHVSYCFRDGMHCFEVREA